MVSTSFAELDEDEDWIINIPKRLCPTINNIKSKKISFKTLFMDDMSNFFAFVSNLDGIISDEELKLLNQILNLNYNNFEASRLCSTISEDYEMKLPLTFIIMFEFDLFMRFKNISKGCDDPSYISLFNIYETFRLIGLEIIYCDNNLSDGASLIRLMLNWKQYLLKIMKKGDIILKDYFVNDLNRKNICNSELYSNQDVDDAYDKLKNDIKYDKKQDNSKQILNDKPIEEDIEFTDFYSIEDVDMGSYGICSEHLNELINELNNLIGLNNVKQDVVSLINFLKIKKLRELKGIKQPPISLHLVFSGNPGTGKTTVARLLARIYAQMGLLSIGHLVETDRSGLVGGYVGQTAIQVQEVIQEAIGGILFIDEAYTLSKGQKYDYGQEAIDTLLKAMEDNRDDFIVIVAGYPDLMEEFLQSNPGLKSRFNKYIYFEDYNAQELFDIFELLCVESNLSLSNDAEIYVKSLFENIYNNREDNFANGREVRNLFEKVLSKQANRLASLDNITDFDLNTLIIDDFK